MNLVNIELALIEKNKKTQGYIEVGESAPLLPITVICGKREGKTILITGGVHNDEYVGIQAAIRLSQILNPEEVTGNIIIMPLVNRSGFEHRTRSTVYEDGKNINREFPGSKEGSLAEIICYFMEKEIFRYIDYYIDLHSGDGHEQLKPYVYCQGKASDEVCKVSESMAKNSDVEYIVKSQIGTGGAYNYAGSIGIPGILLERGNLGVWSNNEVEKDIYDVKTILKKLQFLEGYRDCFEKNAILITEAFYENAENTGCWYPRYKAGDIVEKGEVLGEIKDYFGNVLEIQVAKEKSVILYQVSSLCVLKNETIIAYGKLPELGF